MGEQVQNICAFLHFFDISNNNHHKSHATDLTKGIIKMKTENTANKISIYKKNKVRDAVTDQKQTNNKKKHLFCALGVLTKISVESKLV